MRFKNYLSILLIGMLWPIGAMKGAVNMSAGIVYEPFHNMDRISRTLGQAIINYRSQHGDLESIDGNVTGHSIGLNIVKDNRRVIAIRNCSLRTSDSCYD